MRTWATLAALLLTALAMSGCAGSTGTLHVQATDAPGNIGDFSSLVVEVDAIEIKGEGDAKSYEPSNPTFDLVRLVNGNLTTLFKGQVDAGNYTKLEIVVSKATGTLKSGGTVDVKAPKGSIFLTQRFSVAAGQQTDFVFDIHVVKRGSGTSGSGDYSLQPNASGSRTSR